MSRTRTIVASLSLVPLLGSISPGTVSAYETDQYTLRLESLLDSTETLDREVNEAIARIAGRWTAGTRPKRFATRLYQEIGGRHWVDKLERFAIRSPEVHRFDPPKRDTIYGDLPFWSTPVIYVVGIGKTIKLNETLVGTDKIGHFLSQGWKYYKRYHRGQPEEKIVRLGLRNERGIFGAASTGVFSNADLVANYEGYRFYRSLFEDAIVANKPAIIRFEGRKAVVQRSFRWADHVNEYWDEALNPNRYGNTLGKHVARNLQELCEVYSRQPQAFVPSGDPDLAERYAHIGLKDASAFRLDQVCSPESVSARVESRSNLP